MFILTTISDLIQIRPNELHKPTAEALEDNINRKYANRVLQNVGLCICLWDVLRASEGLIGQGDGNINVNIEFRLVVFRPYKGEILQGVILESSSQSGLRIGLDFFADVWIPSINLPEGSRIHHDPTDTENPHPTWIWDPNDDIETAFFYDTSEIVRFRVEEEIWHDASPEKPDFGKDANGDLSIRQHVAAGGFNQGDDEKAAALKRPVPYAIIGSMGAAGLGCVHWWRQAEDAGEGDAEGGADVEMQGNE